MNVPRRHDPRISLRALTVLVTAFTFPGATVAQTGTYVPGPHPDWERRSPGEMGFDDALLRAAIDFAVESEATTPRDLATAHDMGFGREPRGEAVGPFRTRGPQSGLVIRHGYIVAEWGEPGRVDMTFSVTKSFLSTTVGLAYDDGLIRNIHDPVRDYLAPVVLEDGDGEPTDLEGRRPKLLFESEHNRTITWDHLLRQTSDWEGTLWGKPEWADRPDPDPSTWLTRPRREAGSWYEYNDTRVNVLALAATNVWRRPLPEVLRERVMDVIGASPTWRWFGYDNSWITLDGRNVQAVSGGGHWGGGMFLNAFDQARLGLLTLWDGRWGDRRILSEEWMAMATTPTGANPGYGFMNYFLNTGREMYPSAPESSFAHRGSGANIVYVDREHDLVVVARWIQGGAFDEFVGKVLAALGDAAGAK
ncbi:MAG: serine hydrolase [Gemmatimonadota bacterium]|nr:serine hydrolase [Gemmatimonadota bacterium]